MTVDQTTGPDEAASDPSASSRQRLGWLNVHWSREIGIGGLRLRWWELAGYVSLLLVAGSMRLWDLGSRAMHHDESLHSFYSWNLYNGDGYSHNPMMHGPFQFEANAAIFLALGDSEVTARLLYVVLGTALVALPFLFRERLGRLGALLVAGLLTFSPAMLYFSRFARNDILMAFWTLGLVICMWRYIDEGKNRYLYVGSALIALAFATKESAFIVTAALGAFLALMIGATRWDAIKSRTDVADASPGSAVMRAGAAVWSAAQSRVRLSEVGRPAAFLILLATLTLPQWSASVSLLQDTPVFDWTNVVLAQPEGSAHIGAPSGGGLVIAFVVVKALLATSIRLGHAWNWPVWWRCALIFYVVWTLLYTTFFTNLAGIGSGMWQSLGYWLVQQGEARGNQPWYYHFLLTSIYEFLPLAIGVVASVYYLRRRDAFGLFLVFWAVSTFVLYTLAAEKMPWLLVNITLPLIVLSGKFLADVTRSIQWRRLITGGGILLLAGVPLLLVTLWKLAFLGQGEGEDASVRVGLALIASLVAMIAAGVYLARRSGFRNFAAFAVIPVALVLLVLTIRAGSRATYQNGDVPVEMIVYTQTTPDIPRLIANLEEAGRVPITVDTTSGFSWPWAWYLRDYPRVDFPSYSSTQIDTPPSSPVVLVHSQNRGAADQVLPDEYGGGERVRHRWWFPEQTYRGLTLGEFLGAFDDRDAWRTAMDYFLYREGVRDRLGSEDSYVYFSSTLPLRFTAAE